MELNFIFKSPDHIRLKIVNHCPVYTRTAVRNEQESLSDLRKNHCPESARISVRFMQEYALIAAIWDKPLLKITQIAKHFRFG